MLIYLCIKLIKSETHYLISLEFSTERPFVVETSQCKPFRLYINFIIGTFAFSTICFISHSPFCSCKIFLIIIKCVCAKVSLS